MAQEPDNQPGPYYVSVVRKGFKDDTRLLAGPYADHAAALADVDKASSIAIAMDPRAAFYLFGTVRMKPEYNEPGILNRLGRM